MYVRVAEFGRTRSPKNVCTRMKILCPINVIYAILSQVTRFFEGFGARYAQKQCFMVKEYTVTCAITIAYNSEINLQICNYAQK